MYIFVKLLRILASGESFFYLSGALVKNTLVYPRLGEEVREAITLLA